MLSTSVVCAGAVFCLPASAGALEGADRVVVAAASISRQAEPTAPDDPNFGEGSMPAGESLPGENDPVGNDPLTGDSTPGDGAEPADGTDTDGTATDGTAEVIRPGDESLRLAQEQAQSDLRAVWVIVAALGAVALGLLILLILYVRATKPSRAAARRAHLLAKRDAKAAKKQAKRDAKAGVDPDDLAADDSDGDPDVAGADEPAGATERVALAKADGAPARAASTPGATPASAKAGPAPAAGTPPPRTAVPGAPVAAAKPAAASAASAPAALSQAATGDASPARPSPAAGVPASSGNGASDGDRATPRVDGSPPRPRPKPGPPRQPRPPRPAGEGGDRRDGEVPRRAAARLASVAPAPIPAADLPITEETVRIIGPPGRPPRPGGPGPGRSSAAAPSGGPPPLPPPSSLVDPVPAKPPRPRRVDAPAKVLGTPDAERVLVRPGQAPVRVPPRSRDDASGGVDDSDGGDSSKPVRRPGPKPPPKSQAPKPHSPKPQPPKDKGPRPQGS